MKHAQCALWTKLHEMSKLCFIFVEANWIFPSALIQHTIFLRLFCCCSSRCFAKTHQTIVCEFSWIIESFPIPIPYEQATFLVRLCATMFSHLFVTMSKPQTENMAKHFRMTCWDLSFVAFDNWIYNILYAGKCCRTADKNV